MPVHATDGPSVRRPGRNGRGVGIVDFRRTATIYSDSSSDRTHAGYGFVARVGKRMVAIGQRFSVRPATSMEAETLAALHAVEAVHALAPDLSRIVVNVDSNDIVRVYRTPRSDSALSEMVSSIRRLGRDNGTAIEMEWVKGHEGGSARGCANEISHRLAWLGRLGETISVSAEFGSDWRRRLKEIDARLDGVVDDSEAKKFEVIPFEKAAAYIGVPQDTVARLIQHGHLDYDMDGVVLKSALRVKRALQQMQAGGDVSLGSASGLTGQPASLILESK